MLLANECAYCGTSNESLLHRCLQTSICKEAYLQFCILGLSIAEQIRAPRCMQACHHTVPELYKINPDLPSSVQCGDCIALPRSCMPRMYRTQRGDTWAGIAGWLNMPPARLRARNREAAVRTFH